jgi:hypothetical protein
LIKTPVEALDLPILHALIRLDEEQRDTVFLGPQVEGVRPIVLKSLDLGYSLSAAAIEALSG